ncbi:MAG: hypothetical protein NW703_07925 [Nitrospiraceae bacterium]
MARKVHLIAGLLATLTISTFFLSTILVERLEAHEAVATVRSLIVLPDLFVLVPTIAAQVHRVLSLKVPPKSACRCQEETNVIHGGKWSTGSYTLCYRSQPLERRQLNSTQLITLCGLSNFWPEPSTLSSWV